MSRKRRESANTGKGFSECEARRNPQLIYDMASHSDMRVYYISSSGGRIELRSGAIYIQTIIFSRLSLSDT